MIRYISLLIFPISSSLSKHHPKGLLCKFCESIQENFFSSLKTNKVQIRKLLKTACSLGLTDYTCEYFLVGFADNFFDLKPEFVSINDYFCSHMLSVCDKKTKQYDFEAFRKELKRKYPRTDKKKSIDTGAKGKPFRILALNDIHVQPDYAFNSNASCGDPAGCCSDFFVKPKSDKDRARYWGTPNKNCDIPAYTFEKSIEFIKKNIKKITFVSVLGDIYGHSYFRKKPQELIDTNQYVYDVLKGNFTDPQIIPIMGNHECHPVDNLDFSDPNNFVYKNIFPIFSSMIGQEKVNQMKEKGFYTLEYEEFNVKFLQINMQMDDTYNSYQVVNNTNPLGFFDKIGDELYISEQKNQKVIIQTHIPVVGNHGYSEFDRNMRVVLSRFKDTISTVLSAHTHHDSISFIKDFDTGEVIGANFISPSLTTFSSYEPSFRVYDFNDGEMENYHQWSMDIDSFNEKAEKGDFSFEFYNSYNYRDYYQLGEMSIKESFSFLKDKLFNDDDTFKKYF